MTIKVCKLNDQPTFPRVKSHNSRNVKNAFSSNDLNTFPSENYQTAFIQRSLQTSQREIVNIILQERFFPETSGRLHGLAVACWIRDHHHPCSNLVVAISEGCFISDFASLPLEVARPI